MESSTGRRISNRRCSTQGCFLDYDSHTYQQRGVPDLILVHQLSLEHGDESSLDGSVLITRIILGPRLLDGSSNTLWVGTQMNSLSFPPQKEESPKGEGEHFPLSLPEILQDRDTEMRRVRIRIIIMI